MEVLQNNVRMNPDYSPHQKPESTPVHVEYTVDMSEYGFLKIEVLIWSCVKYRFRLEVTSTIKLTVSLIYDFKCNLMQMFHEFLNNLYFLLQGFCPEPSGIDNAVRSAPSTQYEVGTNVTYTCDQCYTGGGTSTCECNRKWSPVEECSSELFELKTIQMFHINLA